MEKMKIITAPHPVLKQKAKPIKSFDLKLKKFGQQLLKTLQEAENPSGVGLAAPQVGESKRLFAVALPDQKPFLVINPQIIDHSQEKTYFFLADEHHHPFLEGCLSVPNTYGQVKRWPAIGVVFQDENGKEKKMFLKNFDAIVFQHEYDHLEGILFTQRIIEQKGEIIHEETPEIKKAVKA